MVIVIATISDGYCKCHNEGQYGAIKVVVID